MKTEGNKIHILDETNKKKKEEKFINTIQREKKIRESSIYYYFLTSSIKFIIKTKEEDGLISCFHSILLNYKFTYDTNIFHNRTSDKI